MLYFHKKIHVTSAVFGGSDRGEDGGFAVDAVALTESDVGLAERSKG